MWSIHPKVYNILLITFFILNTLVLPSGIIFHKKDYLLSLLYLIIPLVSFIAFVVMYFIDRNNLYMSEYELGDEDSYQIMVNWWAIIVCCYCVHALCLVFHFILLSTMNLYMYFMAPIYLVFNVIITIFIVYGKKYAAGFKVIFVDICCFGNYLNDFNYNYKGKFDDYEDVSDTKLVVSDYDESLEDSLELVIEKPMDKDGNGGVRIEKDPRKKKNIPKPRKLIISGEDESTDFKKYIIEDSDQRNNLLLLYANSFRSESDGLIIITNGWSHETYSSQRIIEISAKKRRMNE